MKKILLILLWIIIQLPGVCAETVSEAEASHIALNWLNAYSEKSFISKDISSIETINDSGDDLIYIVSFKPAGWVMISASSKTEPVLGYSDKSDFNVEVMPIQLEGWVDGLKHEIRAAIDDESYQPAHDLSAKWSILKSANANISKLKSSMASAGPLLTTTWNQGRYYNEMAPADAASSALNGHVWIGCVATAMAQVMKYWEYPLSGTGEHSYNHPDYGTQYANFDNATYDWDAMPNDLNLGNSEVQEISYHAAVAVNMDFGPGASGAYLSDARDALTEFFKYNTTVFLSDKSKWDSDLLWMQMLRDEIDNGRPVVYSGYNASLTSGHAFVCDGYSSGDYFHFNWGWGGAYDGSFKLTALIPSKDRNYSTNQSAIFGIEPVQTAPISIPYTQSFESGLNGFSLFGKAARTAADAHSGTYAVRLSQSGFSSHSLNVANLTFVVPDDGVLDFWVKRFTNQASGTNTQKALLMPEHGDEPLITFFDGDFDDDEWMNFHQDISAYAGQIVRLMFVQQNFDYSREQWMFVDDVVITGGAVNLAPYEPSGPTPVNNATAMELTPVLRWQGGDPNGDDVVYSVYFGENSSPVLAGSTFDRFHNPGQLQHKTKYYWKVEASDGRLTSVSPVWSFTTQGMPPVVETCGVPFVTSDAATICGRIVDDKGSSITEKGICWDSRPGVNLSDNTRQIFGSDADFEAELSGLQPYTTYYAKAYAITDDGVGYGEELQFETQSGLPELALSGIDSIKRSSAVVTGFIHNVNDEYISRRGVLWSQNNGFNVETATEVSEVGSWDCVCDFSIHLNDLPGPDTIYYRFFADNSVGRAYSEQTFFVTTNQPPSIDLDADNSSGKYGNHYWVEVYEQQSGGVIADVDVEISDADGDIMQRVIIKIDVRQNDNEYLVVRNISPDVQVYGEYTDSMVIENSSLSSNAQWCSVLRTVEFYSDNDAPDINLQRKVSVTTSDGYDTSLEAVAFFDVRPVNDAPVNIHLPGISSLPVFGASISPQQGEWADTIDNLVGAGFEYAYQWQWTDGDSVFDVPEASESILVGEQYCGMQLRVVETVTDVGSGGDNIVNSSIYSEWFDVGKKPQEVLSVGIQGFEEKKPLLTYRAEPYRFEGLSSSGLPLRFGTHNDDVLEVLGDSLYVKKTTNAHAVWAIQDGNACFEPANYKYMIVQIEKGHQLVEIQMDSMFRYGDELEFIIYPDDSLSYSVVSDDSTVVRVESNTLVATGVGSVGLHISNPGNDLWLPADTLVEIVVQKGIQHIDAADTIYKHFGDEAFVVEASASSGLTVLPVYVEQELASIHNDRIEVNKPGTGSLVVSQSGNEYWNEVYDTLTLVVEKSLQHINFETLDTLVYGGSGVELMAVSSSGLPVRYVSSDSSVAQIDSNRIVVKGAGVCSIAAIQQGDAYYRAADTVSQTLYVQKAGQFIETALPDSITTRQLILMSDFYASSGLRGFDFSSSNPNVIRIEADSIVVVDRGEALITVSHPGNNNYLPSSADFHFVVSFPLDIEEFESLTVEVFPNPANDRLHIMLDGEADFPLDYSLLNILGQVQLKGRLEKSFSVIDIEGLKSGIYVLLLRSKEHYLKEKVIVK